MKTKVLLSALIVLAFTIQVNAQWANKSFTFETKLRQYLVYVPPVYNPANPAALVITLHGLGDNMTNFSGIGMNLIADTANFIVLVPQALYDPYAGNAWNAGAGLYAYYPNSAINDIGFLNAMIDSTIAQYVIDPLRVYMCGFSLGGFMTERMACESNYKIAAFASVAGTIGNGLSLCNPGRAVSIAHFHGTSDATAGYYTNDYGINTDSLINFWVANNQCDTSAIHTDLPDIAADGYTVETFIYPNGLQNTEVELYKVNGADHVWLFQPQNDISYSIEIWKFFSKYQLPVSVADIPSYNEQNILIYPNPADDNIFIESR
ncbi:MAG: hypothetical protein HY738_22760, partial [Bacteroidia bacterium]|nr:hypothetical protein [Bacteroidia bacterium]